MVGLSRRDRGGLGLRSVPRILPGSGTGPDGRTAHPVGRRRQPVAAAVDRVCDGRVVEGPNRRGSAGDDGGARVLFWEVEGVGRRAIEEWVYRVGPEPWAMVSTRTAETIHEALERCRVRDVLKWCAEKLGVSVQSQRRQAYGKPKCATNPG